MKKTTKALLSFLFLAFIPLQSACAIFSSEPTYEEYQQIAQEAREKFPQIRGELEVTIQTLDSARKKYFQLPVEEEIAMGSGNTPTSIEKWRLAYGDNVGDALEKVYELHLKISFWGKEYKNVTFVVLDRGRQYIAYVYAPNVKNVVDEYLDGSERLDVDWYMWSNWCNAS